MQQMDLTCLLHFNKAYAFFALLIFSLPAFASGYFDDTGTLSDEGEIQSNHDHPYKRHHHFFTEDLCENREPYFNKRFFTPGKNNASINQTGNTNQAEIGQRGGENNADIEQSGILNEVEIMQYGFANNVEHQQLGGFNTLSATQFGHHNSIEQIQLGNGFNSRITQFGAYKSIRIIQGY